MATLQPLGDSLLEREASTGASRVKRWRETEIQSQEPVPTAEETG